MTQDTTHAEQHTERVHRCTGAKWPTTRHTQHNTPSGHTGEREPRGPGRRTRNTPHRAGAPVNRSQVARDTADTIQRTTRAHRWTGAKRPGTPRTSRAAEGQERTNTPWVGHTGATLPTQRARGRSGTPRPLVQARPGCIGNHGKRHPEPWKQPVTVEPVHSQGGGRLPGRVAPQLKPQG